VNKKETVEGKQGNLEKEEMTKYNVLRCMCSGSLHLSSRRPRRSSWAIVIEPIGCDFSVMMTAIQRGTKGEQDHQDVIVQYEADE
jgi:hypothetical protein